MSEKIAPDGFVFEDGEDFDEPCPICGALHPDSCDEMTHEDAYFAATRIVFNRSTKVVVAKAPKSHKKQDTGKQPTAELAKPKNYSSEARDIAGDQPIANP